MNKIINIKINQIFFYIICKINKNFNLKNKNINNSYNRKNLFKINKLKSIKNT